MAGGGIKGGIAHGATDELGFHAVQDRHYVTDIHATVLHQLGLDPRRLEVPGHKRLEIDFGKADSRDHRVRRVQERHRLDLSWSPGFSRSGRYGFESRGTG